MRSGQNGLRLPSPGKLAPLTFKGRSVSLPDARSKPLLGSLERRSIRRTTISSSQSLMKLAKRFDNDHSHVPAAQDPKFFELIQLNPSDPQERAKFDEKQVKRYIRQNPGAVKAVYDFPVGGRGQQTVSRHPLSALVALGASRSLVKAAIKANPTALKACKDFGSTALHTACSFDTDMDVVRYLHEKHPQAIQGTTKLVFLPLHNACAKTNPSLEMIQFLVQEYPKGLLAINKLGDTPVRTAQRNASASKEVLAYLEEETLKVSSLEENQDVWEEVSARQSWGSHQTKTVLEAATRSLTTGAA